MSGNTENTADTSIELLHTTIDAVGLDTGFNSGSIAMIPFMAGLIPSLIFLAITCSALVGLVARNWQEARHHGKYAAVLAVVVALVYWPLVVDSHIYSENPLRRLVSSPALVDEEHPGSDNNTVVAAIHDQVQDELDRRREGLADLGADKECRTQMELTGNSRDSLSVLCGGYSLDPVVTDKATLIPSVTTDADEPWWPWSVDPHAVEVTVSIEVDKK